MTPEKSRTRPGRRDLLRSQAANARRRARQQARQAGKGYDKQSYDKPLSEVS